MFFYQVIEALERNGILYMVTGGYAVALHGYIRKTFDIDLITDTSREGLTEMEYALKDCGLRPEKYGAKNAYNLRDAEKSWIFINPKDETQRIDIHLNYAIDSFAPFTKRIQSYQVPIIAFDDLLRIKRESPLEKDKNDLKRLLEVPR